MANYQGKLASAIQRTFDNFEKSFDKSFENSTLSVNRL